MNQTCEIEEHTDKKIESYVTMVMVFIGAIVSFFEALERRNFNIQLRKDRSHKKDFYDDVRNIARDRTSKTDDPDERSQ